jgi:hypothetical protein
MNDNDHKPLSNSRIKEWTLFKESIFISLGILAAGFGLKGFLLPNGFIDGGSNWYFTFAERAY